MHQRAYAFRLKRPAEIEVMCRAGVILADCLDHVASLVQAGVSTAELNSAADTRVGDDQWTVSTLDGRRSCYFEHTVAVLDDGPHVLTSRRSSP